MSPVPLIRPFVSVCVVREMGIRMGKGLVIRNKKKAGEKILSIITRIVKAFLWRITHTVVLHGWDAIAILSSPDTPYIVMSSFIASPFAADAAVAAAVV